MTARAKQTNRGVDKLTCVARFLEAHLILVVAARGTSGADRVPEVGPDPHRELAVLLLGAPRNSFNSFCQK